MKEPRQREEWHCASTSRPATGFAAAYGWTDPVFTHISARPGEGHEFLINPYGLLFEEITASSLVKVDQDGHS